MNRDEFTRKMHSKLDQWNNDIDALDVQKESIEESVRAELDERLNDLRTQRDRAKSQLAALQNASATAWQDMKAGVELAWDAITQAIDSAKSRYK